MKLPEQDAFYADLLALVSEVMDSQVIRGGDLSVHPISTEQQQTLLNQLRKDQCYDLSPSETQMLKV